jgi:GNAT acetyltransferase-like protein
MKLTIGNLELARFTAEDTRALHRIRNHVSVRQHLPDTRPIPYRAHAEWVRKNLLEERRVCLFMARWHGETVGFTSLKNVGGDAVEIGSMFREAKKLPLVPMYSTVVTIWYAFFHLGMCWLVSYPAPTNEAALAINRCFDPWEVESDRPGTIKLCVSRQVCLASQAYQRVFGRIKDRLIFTDDSSTGP